MVIVLSTAPKGTSLPLAPRKSLRGRTVIKWLVVLTHGRQKRRVLLALLGFLFIFGNIVSLHLSASHNYHDHGQVNPDSEQLAFSPFAHQVMLDIPQSEAFFPFFTGIFDKQLQTAYERQMMNATGTTAKVLLIVTVRPGDYIEDAIGTLDFLLGTAKHWNSSSDFNVCVSVLVSQVFNDGELHSRLNAIGRRHRQKTIDVLISPIPFHTMVEALAIVAHHASQTSHFVSLIVAGTRPTNVTSAEQDFTLLLSKTLGGITNQYMNPHQKIRLAYANLLDAKSVPESYHKMDAVGGRVFHSHLVVRIASLLAYCGELSLLQIPRSLQLNAFSSQSFGMGLLADSVVVDATPALFEVPDPFCGDKLTCPEPFPLDNEFNIVRRMILAEQTFLSSSLNRSRQEIAFCLSTVSRPNLTHPYVLQTLRSLLDELSSYSHPRDQMSVLVQVGGMDLADIASHRAIIEGAFADQLGTGLLKLVDAPIHLYPTTEDIRHNYFNSSREGKGWDAWRSKQNLDYSALFQTMATVSSKYIMVLEDDIDFKPECVHEVMTRINQLQNNEEPWTMLDVSYIGFAGKLFRRQHAAALGLLTRIFYDEQPCDWLKNYICWFDKRRWGVPDENGNPRNHKISRPWLLTHRGKISSNKYGNEIDQEKPKGSISKLVSNKGMKVAVKPTGLKLSTTWQEMAPVQSFDRRIYPWGLRICSNAGPGELKTNERGQDVFEVRSVCEVDAGGTELLYVHIGDTLEHQKHLVHTLKQSRRANPCIRFRLLVSRSAFDGEPELRQVAECHGVTVVFTDNFEADPLLLQLRENFFIVGDMGTLIGNKNFNLFTTSRMFYVRAYMEKEGVRRVFHLENDNPAYVDLLQLGDAYEACGYRIGAPIRNAESFILGFSYLTTDALTDMVRYFVNCFKEGKEKWVARLGRAWVNDMTLTADYANKHAGAISQLPVNPNNKSCAHNASSIFVDGACVGIWFLGTSHNRDGPFQSHGWGAFQGSFDPRTYDFGWREQPDHLCSGPMLIPKNRNGQSLRYANLHIHNKEIDRAMPACRRHQKYPFRVFGNLNSSLREDMARDLDKALPPELVKGGEKDRRSSAPLVTGDGFRSLCRHRCDETGCNFEPSKLRRGDCIFIEDMGMDNKAVPHLVKIVDEIKVPFIIVSHNSDHSYPFTEPRRKIAFDYSELLETQNARHWFSTNCDWRNSTTEACPTKLSCIPIGIENRYNKIGSDPSRYFASMKLPQQRTRVLYLSFRPAEIKPQRKEVLDYIQSLGNTSSWITPWSHHSWDEFAREVRDHRFTLCPHGHGLDTHRHWEVLLLGGVPVVKTSTLDSLFEELPVVILEDWAELTKARLEKEWTRIKKSEFRLDKLYWPYWENQVRQQMDIAKSYF